MIQRKRIYTVENKNRNIELIVDTVGEIETGEFAAQRDAAEEEVSGERGGFWRESKQKAVIIWASFSCFPSSPLHKI